MPRKPKYNRIFVVDLEATCWRDGVVPDGCRQETIEFGVCPYLIEEKEIGDPFSIFVKPGMSTINEYCTELTGHTQESIDANGLVFPEACEKLKKDYRSLDGLWATWGIWDYDLIRKDCEFHSCKFPFSKNMHMNIKSLFVARHGVSRTTGVSTALQTLGLEFEGQPHSGKDDAYNTARILKAIL